MEEVDKLITEKLEAIINEILNSKSNDWCFTGPKSDAVKADKYILYFSNNEVCINNIKTGKTSTQNDIEKYIDLSIINELRRKLYSIQVDLRTIDRRNKLKEFLEL